MDPFDQGDEGMLNVRAGTPADAERLSRYDRHIPENELARVLSQGRVLMAYSGERFIGWLRYGLFWDEIPMMNLLLILEGERGKGYGRALVAQWERRMAAEGHRRVMTSTQADEAAQHFYRKLGYRDAGVLLLPEQAAELLMMKDLV